MNLDFTNFPSLIPASLAQDVLTTLGGILPGVAPVVLGIGVVSAVVGLVFALAWKGIGKIRSAR